MNATEHYKLIWMRKNGTLLMATLMMLLALTTDSYAWGFRKRKAEKTDTAIVKTGRYDEITKKAKSRDGMFTIHQVEGDWYFELPDTLMGRDILIVNKVSGVPYELNDAGLNKGMSYEDKLIRFHKDIVQKKVWVTTWNPRVRSEERRVGKECLVVC